MRGFLLDSISFHHWTKMFSFVNKPSLFLLISKFRTKKYIENLLSSSKIDLFLHCHNLLSWIYHRVRFWARLLLADCFQEVPYQPSWYLTQWQLWCSPFPCLDAADGKARGKQSSSHPMEGQGGQVVQGSTDKSKQASSRAAEDQRWRPFCSTYGEGMGFVHCNLLSGRLKNVVSQSGIFCLVFCMYVQLNINDDELISSFPGFNILSKI